MKPNNCLHIVAQGTGLGDVSTRFLMYMSKFQGIYKKKSQSVINNQLLNRNNNYCFLQSQPVFVR